MSCRGGGEGGVSCREEGREGCLVGGGGEGGVSCRGRRGGRGGRGVL